MGAQTSQKPQEEISTTKELDFSYYKNYLMKQDQMKLYSDSMINYMDVTDIQPILSSLTIGSSNLGSKLCSNSLDSKTFTKEDLLSQHPIKSLLTEIDYFEVLDE